MYLNAYGEERRESELKEAELKLREREQAIREKEAGWMNEWMNG